MAYLVASQSKCGCSRATRTEIHENARSNSHCCSLSWLWQCVQKAQYQAHVVCLGSCVLSGNPFYRNDLENRAKEIGLDITNPNIGVPVIGDWDKTHASLTPDLEPTEHERTSVTSWSKRHGWPVSRRRVLSGVSAHWGTSGEICLVILWNHSKDSRMSQRIMEWRHCNVDRW
jgi:hypothetical protein